VNLTLSGTTLSWQPTWSTDPMNAAVTGTEATVAEYDVYALLQGGASAMEVGSVPCAPGSCGHTFDLAALGISGGSYEFYVQAVGQPSIRNHLAGPTLAQSF
jgi:hypothetical protein